MTYDICRLALLSILCGIGTALADNDRRIALATPDAAQGQSSINQTGECPNQGGVLDSVSVVRGDSLQLVVQLPLPAPEGGVSIRIRTDAPSIAAAGDKQQGFLPLVFVPEGEFFSNPFTVFGNAVGETVLRGEPLSPLFLPFAVPLGTWDVGKPRGKFLDPNSPGAAHCRVADDSSELSRDEVQLADCGKQADGLVTDGVSRLLMRLQSGLSGTGCFEIVTSGDNLGEIGSNVKTTQPVNELNQVSAYYRSPKSFQDGAQLRTVKVEFAFTPDFGNGNTTRLRAETTLMRPPLVLVHGLWSDPGTWVQDLWVRNELIPTTIHADYESSNAATFDTNVSAIRDALDSAVVNTTEETNFSVTQADIVAHSMGGILSRLFVQDAEFARADNLGKGDIRRLVTLATPHLGSSFANLVVALHNTNPEETEALIRDMIGAEASASNGAICDLAENSPAIIRLSNGTGIPAHVVTATGGPSGSVDEPALYWEGVLGQVNFEGALTREECLRISSTPPVRCLESRPLFDQGIVDGHRFRQANDIVVPLSSAGAALSPSSAARRPFDVIHFGRRFWGFNVVDGPTNVDAVASHVFDTLDVALDNNAWASSLPSFGPVPPSPLPQVPSVNGTGAPWTVPGIPGGDAPDVEAFTAQCGPGGPLASAAAAKSRSSGAGTTADPRIEVTRPSDGTVFRPGQTIDIAVEVEPSTFTDVTIGVRPGASLDAQTTDAIVWEGQFIIPELRTGELRIVPRGRTVEGERVSAAGITVRVIPAETPDEISVIPTSRLRLQADTEETAQIRVKGDYGGGIVRSLTKGFLGTTYSSDSPSVATVDQDGRVSAVSPGTATITVDHRGLREFVSVVVLGGGSKLLPPSDVTQRVEITRGGLRLNRNTGFFVQELRITNQGATPVIGPLHALVKQLPESVRLVNRHASTERVEPLGAPFVRLRRFSGVDLGPGETAALPLRFLNAERVGIDYRIALIQTGLDP